jgi:hypothetical protein
MKPQPVNVSNRTTQQVPSPPISGEKVADRPDEGAAQEGRVREIPPHPALSPKSFAATLLCHAVCNHANDLGERGQKLRCPFGRSFTRRALAALIFILFTHAPVWGQQTQTVRIVEVVWGFDGRVVTGQFMPLSILVDNLSDQPIEANATLRSVYGMVNETGGVTTQPVFLGPNSRRWVQFYPYIFGRARSWRFALETEDKTYHFDSMDQPRAVFDNSRTQGETDQTLPAVILDPPGMASRAPTTVKHMPSEIFPPYATAMHGLYALFLDHVPDWETPRQEALLSWLKSGGRLHLLLDSNNQTLRFSGILSSLNEPFPQFSVGSGLVTRHDVQRAGLQSQIVTPAVTPPELSAEETADITAFNQTQHRNFGSGLISDDEVFSELRELTQPDHAWLLIFLLSLCYVGLIFPGCWILSKQRTLHFFVTYGAIAGLAAVFSLIFLIIGRRGYGESTSMHTLAMARAEDETHWSTLQYNTLFVTSGDTYTVDEKDRQTLLTSGSADEKVDARIISGNTARFVCRIPPFSSQAILSRRRLTTDSWGLAVTGFTQNGSQLGELSMSFNDKFPAGEDVKCYVIHGQYLHEASITPSSKVLILNNTRHRLRDFGVERLENSRAGGFFMFGVPVRREPEKDPVEACFERALRQMIARSLADDFVNEVARFQLPEGRIRLLVYAPLPESLELAVSAETRRVGRILYVRDMPLQAEGPK